ncbi:macro domain-containing protein [Endozoicomonas sp. ALD040]|uniref:macro domain-containing protein n=1 Tax=unclassified Endozoicomonas TaxID=2644528 RepID=UPI003BAE2699
MVKFHAFRMGALSCLGLIITGTDVLAASGLPTFREGRELYTLLFILLIAVAVGLFIIRRRNNIELSLTDNTDTKIEFGDIFKESGLIVIPVNEYFDTIVDDRIIAKNTLHGQFIERYYKDDQNPLKKEIQKGLKGLIPKVNSARRRGNKNSYDLGTAVRVDCEGKSFLLIAMTRFNEQDRAEVTWDEYTRVLARLSEHIHTHAQARPVCMPLMGGGQAGVDTPQRLLKNMFITMSLNRKLTLPGGLKIVLHESVKDKVDLTKIRLELEHTGS